MSASRRHEDELCEAIEQGELASDDPELAKRFAAYESCEALFDRLRLPRELAAEVLRRTDDQHSENPSHIGRYCVIAACGSGGFGVVYLAYDETLKRKVAIKVRKRELIEDPERFLREARLAAALDKHPGIVLIHDAGFDNGTCYIVSEYVNGKTLAEHIDEHGPLEPRLAADIVYRAAKALAYAHGKGVVHRDLTAANILIQPDGSPKITDFGSAVRLGDAGFGGAQATGTKPYLPPEYIRRVLKKNVEKENSRRQRVRNRSRRQSSEVPGKKRAARPIGKEDVYSLGVVFYQALTGQLPFTAKNDDQLYGQILKGELRAPQDIKNDIPKELATICLRCLDRDPSTRWGAGDLASALRSRLFRDRWLNLGNRRMFLAAAIALAVCAVLVMSVLHVFGINAARQIDASLSRIEEKNDAKVTEKLRELRELSEDIFEHRMRRAVEIIALDTSRDRGSSSPTMEKVDPKTRELVSSLREAVDQIVSQQRTYLEDLAVRVSKALLADALARDEHGAQRVLNLVSENDARQVGSRLGFHIYCLRGSAFARLGDWAAALSCYQAARPYDALSTAWVRCVIAHCWHVLEQWPRHIEYCEDLIAFLKQHDALDTIWLGYAHLYHGYACARSGDAKTAEADYRAGLRSFGTSRWKDDYSVNRCRHQLITLLIHGGRLDEALEEVDRGLEIQEGAAGSSGVNRQTRAALLHLRATINAYRFANGKGKGTIADAGRDIEKVVELLGGNAALRYWSRDVPLLRAKVWEMQDKEGAKFSYLECLAPVWAEHGLAEGSQRVASRELPAAFGLSWSSTITKTLSALTKCSDTEAIEVLYPLRTFDHTNRFRTMTVRGWDEAISEEDFKEGLEQLLRIQANSRSSLTSLEVVNERLVDNYKGGFLVAVSDSMRWKGEETSIHLFLVFKGSDTTPSISDTSSLVAVGGVVRPTSSPDDLLWVLANTLQTAVVFGGDTASMHWNEHLSGIDRYFEGRLANWFLAEPSERQFPDEQCGRIDEHWLMIRDLFAENRPVEKTWTAAAGTEQYWMMRASDRSGGELYAWGVQNKTSPKNYTENGHVVFYLRRGVD